MFQTLPHSNICSLLIKDFKFSGVFLIILWLFYFILYFSFQGCAETAYDLKKREFRSIKYIFGRAVRFSVPKPTKYNIDEN